MIRRCKWHLRVVCVIPGILLREARSLILVQSALHWAAGSQCLVLHPLGLYAQNALSEVEVMDVPLPHCAHSPLGGN